MKQFAKKLHYLRENDVLFLYMVLHIIIKITSFSELSDFLNQITNKNDNFIVNWDLNIDILDNTKDHYKHLGNLCDTFSLNNLIKRKNCFIADSGRSFHKASIIETGCSDHHNLIFCFFRTHFERLKSKKLEYRNYKKFDESKFLFKLDQELLKGKMYKTQNNMFTTFTDVFRSVLNKHISLKTKIIRRNQAPFMTKALRKVIMTRSWLRSKYNKWQSSENVLAFRKAKNYRNNLNKMTKKAYFEQMTSRGFVNGKSFWKTVKPFLTNKGFFTCQNITVINKGKFISDNLKLTEIFNTHYINIVENSSGIPPSTAGNPNNPLEDSNTVKNIIKEYKNHPRLINIGNHTNLNVNIFDFPCATSEEINKIIKCINSKKATGPAKIKLKIIKLSANIIDSHFTNVINNYIDSNHFFWKCENFIGEVHF